VSHLDVTAMGSGDLDEECAVFVGPVGQEYHIRVECSSCSISS
jgi:hypothetical protein